MSLDIGLECRVTIPLYQVFNEDIIVQCTCNFFPDKRLSKRGNSIYYYRKRQIVYNLVPKWDKIVEGSCRAEN